MGYKFDSHGFMIIPDPRDYKRKKRHEKEIEELKVVVICHAYCPNGHDVMTGYVNFNGHDGIKLKIARPNGEEGEMVYSPIFGDKSIVYIGIKPDDGEKLEIFCPVCGVEIPVLSPCESCDVGEMRVLSQSPEFDITNGVTFCDLVGCPCAYLLNSGDLIEQAQLEEL